MSDPVSAITGGASIVGGLMGSDSASSAADTQSAAANAATAEQKRQFDITQANLKPFLTAGTAAENRLADLLGVSGNTGAAGYGSLMRDFGMSDFQADPGYNFRLNEGLKALDRTAAARGGLLSGSALKGAERYGQDVASQEYQNAYNRYQTNRANKLNPLQSLAGQGQTTANTLGTLGSDYASNVGSNYMNAANARASGYIGSANAWSNALGTAANAYGQQNTLNRILGGGGGITGGWGTGTVALPASQNIDYYLAQNP